MCSYKKETPTENDSILNLRQVIPPNSAWENVARALFGERALSLFHYERKKLSSQMLFFRATKMVAVSEKTDAATPARQGDGGLVGMNKHSNKHTAQGQCKLRSKI